MNLIRTMVFVALGAAAVPGAVAQSSHRAQGRPSTVALASARAKEDSMRRPRGPVAVTLTAEEMASLIQAGLQPAARRALDSVLVELHPGRLTLRGMLVTTVWGAEALGPLAYMLDPMEPMVVSGPARVTGPGVIAWEPDSLTIRSFSIPGSAVPRLVNRLTGGTSGTIPIAAPPTVTQIRIQSGSVTFSRK